MRSGVTLLNGSINNARFGRLALRVGPHALVFCEAAMTALANFTISITVARIYDKTVFSGYITALSAAFVAIAVLRISFTMPSAVRPDSWYWRKLPALAAVHVFAIVTAVILTTLVLWGVTRILDGDLWHFAAIAAPGVCLWFLGYEFERGFLIKQRAFFRLVIMSLSQLTLLAVATLCVVRFKLPFHHLVLAMAGLGILRSLVVLSAVPAFRWRKGFIQMKRGIHKLGPSSAAYLLGGVACSHVPVFALSIYATPEQAAAFGAMRTLYQPAQIFFRSRDVVRQARFHADRLAAAGTIQAQYLSRVTRSFLLSSAFGLGLAIFGSQVVHLAYAGRYDAHLPTFFLWAVIMIFINLAAITDAYISYLNLQSRYSIVQACCGLGMLILSPVLVAHWGDIGGAIATIGGWSIVVIGGAVLLLKSSASLECRATCN